MEELDSVEAVEKYLHSLLIEICKKLLIFVCLLFVFGAMFFDCDIVYTNRFMLHNKLTYVPKAEISIVS